ncbi:VPS13 domain-containing protein [Mycena chlorophos]|uniref:VPS13 domain-containing protein n=1 Tax=Mycena chlorophos TaxID=658473 RepID=A0A8H6TMG9_MYCCL|nr:VPS13 domain-containing protein [Mycena chlorophos]
MSLPRLLKKLSSKSLKKSKRTGSNDDGPKTAASDVSFGEVMARPPVNGSSEHVVTGYAYIPPPVPPLPPPTVQVSIPQDELSLSLQDAWKSANTNPKTSKADKMLLRVENGIQGAMTREAQGASELTIVETELTAVGVLETIENGIHSLAEGMPVLMNALDEVAKLHPFVGVAVMAFKAVWALEQKRRDNDKKILALHVEMKDMMSILLQLKTVKDVDAKAPNGETIKGRMQVIVETAAKNIKGCANACDTYVKKKLVVKVIKGPIWEGKLAAFSGEFTKRRDEFQLALSMHTALGVDAAVRGIDSLADSSKAIEAKIDMMMKLFAQMASPEQKELTRLAGDQKGTPSDEVLKRLNEEENRLSGAQGNSKEQSATKDKQLADLKAELKTTADAAIAANMEVFDRKFEIQRRQIEEAVERAVKRQGDRIIGAVLAGPHDRIKDPNVHAVWQEMAWRGSVKARHFVMALRDHFQEDHKHKYKHKSTPSTSDTKAPEGADSEASQPKVEVPPIPKEDEWALDFISIFAVLTSITAFDDDASGFVTVSEVNTFTSMRPHDWSIARWIAYWSIGHHQTMLSYAEKINEILTKMFAIRPHILPANKQAANSYLENVYIGVYSLVGSLEKRMINTGIQAKFESYVTQEEERIRLNLESVKYDLDDSATLALVAGEGRIERTVFPLLYLLLKRHLEIFRVGQKHTLDTEELWDAADTVTWVLDAVNARVELLQSVFQQQKLDVAQQFKSFSFGLYAAINNPDLLWADKVIQETEFADYHYEDSFEEPLPTVDKILNYPADEERLDFAAYAPPGPPPSPDASLIRLHQATGLFSKRWNGFNYGALDALYPVAGMLSMTFEPTTLAGDIQRFAAAERANSVKYNIDGECRLAEDDWNTMVVTFKRSFPSDPDYPAQHYHALWVVGSNTLTGTWGNDEDVAAYDNAFMFKQIDPQDACFMPAPIQIKPTEATDSSGRNSKARALWAFALNATLLRVRRERWSWSYFEERRHNRKRFIELYFRSGQGKSQFGKDLSSDEWEELSKMKKTLTNLDSRFYHTLAEAQLEATVHHSAWCDNCRGTIGGARVSCLVCQMKGTFNTVDFDESAECIAASVTRDDMQKPHLPHHDLIKLRRVLHIRDFGKTFHRAKDALAHARDLMKDTATSVPDVGLVQSAVQTSAVSKRLSTLPTKLAITIPSSPARGPRSAVSTRTTQTALDVNTSTGPQCANCGKGLCLAVPCWYCVQCEEDTFICWECDAKGEMGIAELLKKMVHKFHAHDLVRVRDKVEEKELTMEERFEEAVKTMELRMGKMEKTVDERLGRVEMLLEQILAR